MREPAQMPTTPPSIASRLGQEAAAMARRLAAALASAAIAREGPLAEAVEFLRQFELTPEQAAPAVAPSDPLFRISAALGLSPFEKDVLVMSGLAEEHEGLAAVLRSLHPRGEPRPTVGLAAQVLCQSAAERVLLRTALECGPLMRSGAVRLVGDAPFFERSLVLADALWSALAGIDAIPRGLTRSAPGADQLGLESWLDSIPARRAILALREGIAATVLVTAADPLVALHRASVLCAAAGQELFAAAADPSGEGPKLLVLHALARGAVPVWLYQQVEGPNAVPVPSFDGTSGPVVVCAPVGLTAPRGSRPVIGVEALAMAAVERARVWARALPHLADEAHGIATRFHLDAPQVAEVASDLELLPQLEQRRASLGDVAESIRARSALASSASVSLIHPSAGWSQLVLPEKRLGLLKEAEARLLNQTRVLDDWRFLAGRPGARGVRMLFSGSPGTGKSLSAEVIAHSLGLDLLIVDLSRVVSKWIGETEKNLAAVFDSAERAQAVLLFDEADALFGKRTEVSDAHDRYANLETAYLLSRLERFEGLAILATNLKQNIDPAFIRRLEFVLEFEEPGPGERLALWRAHLPPTAPCADDVDLEELAGLYPVVGAFIRNAAVAAAFLAAAEGGVITRAHLLRGIQREYEKSGRTFPGMPTGHKR